MGSPLRMTVVDMAGSRPVATEVADPAEAAWSAVSETFEASGRVPAAFT